MTIRELIAEARLTILHIQTLTDGTASERNEMDSANVLGQVSGLAAMLSLIIRQIEWQLKPANRSGDTLEVSPIAELSGATCELVAYETRRRCSLHRNHEGACDFGTDTAWCEAACAAAGCSQGCARRHNHRGVHACVEHRDVID